MKIFCLVFLGFCFFSVKATTYYVKASGGSGQGTSEGTAWSLDKLNAVNIIQGDSVLLKRGDVFYGILKPYDGVIYSNYGTGANPKFTGFSTLGGWTLLRGNIYYTSLDVPSLNVLTLDGEVKGMGRYPNTGYLQYTAHTGTTSITSGATLPFDPTGAEIVVRKYRQVTDRQFIVGVSGNMFMLSGAGAFGTPYLNNNSNTPSDGNGYFVQSHLATLDQLGEWYYDTLSNRLYMHFGTGTSAGHTVQVAKLQRNIEFDNKSNITFLNIDFEGANVGVPGTSMNNINNIKFIGCNILKQQNGIQVDNGCNRLTISGGSMTDILNNALLVNSSTNVIVDGTVFKNVGAISGAGGCGSGSYLAIWIIGDNSIVKNCSLTNVGYHGIVLNGNNTLIEKNFIDRYGFVKDDCGAIYDFQFTGVTNFNKIIRNNTILNGIGAIDGAPPHEQYGQAAGIYLDVACNHYIVENNTISHGPWGGILLIGVGDNNRITNNIVYDFTQGLLIYNYSSLLIRNLTITNNQFIAKTISQFPLYLFMFANDTISKYGTIDRNYYVRPVDDSLTIGINRVYSGGNGQTAISLETWRTKYGQDPNSSKSAVTTKSN